MKNNSMKNNNIKNLEVLKKNLDQILEEIHTVEDPHEITAYRDFFKKNVGFFSRSYVTAYLIKKYLADTKLSSKHNSSNNRNSPARNTNTQASNSQNKTPGQQRISINIGSSAISSDELIKYLVAAPGIESEDFELFKQTERHTVFMFNAKKTRTLLQYTKTTELNGKKPYIDLRGRY